MNAEIHLNDKPPSAAIGALIERYGRLRIAAATLAALLRLHGRNPTIGQSDLPDRLLRDIGLPPVPESLKYWDYLR